MAVRRLRCRRISSEREGELRRGIIDELNRPDEGVPPPDGPVIYLEENGTPADYTCWYAVWDRFEGVDDEDRSRILFDAIKEVRGAKEGLRVAVAMGLTSSEARAMGLGATMAEQVSANE